MKKSLPVAILASVLMISGMHAHAQSRSAVAFDAGPVVPVIHHVQVPPLLGPNDLNKLMQIEMPYILDIRNLSARRALYSYSAGHIPGAVNMPYGEFRGLWNDPLSVPTDAELTDLVQRAGVKLREY